LLAITPRSESWAKRDVWVAESRRLAPDIPAGEAYLASRAEDVAERVHRGHDALAKYDAQELAERTLSPVDGI
jgi:hypothetical protein